MEEKMKRKSTHLFIALTMGMAMILSGCSLAVLPDALSNDTTLTPRALTLEKIAISSANVTASTYDSAGGWTPAKAVDNDLATRWAGNGDGAHITFNLSGLKTVSYVKIAFYNGSTRTFTFDVQTSTNGSTFTNIATGKTNVANNSLQTFDFTDVLATHVRIVGHMNTANTWNSYNEVEIWGGIDSGATPSPSPSPSPISGWTLDTSNVPVKDLAGSGYAATPSTSTTASFDFGLSNNAKSGSGSYQRGEWKYERRSGWNRLNGNFNISASQSSFDKISLAQTHDDSTGSGGVFTIYQIRKSSSSSTGWEFGVQGDTFSYVKMANISLGVTYNLDIVTNSSGSATESAILSTSSGTVLATKSISGGGESLQYKKIGAYGLTGGYGPIKVTWSNVKLYTK